MKWHEYQVAWRRFLQPGETEFDQLHDRMMRTVRKLQGSMQIAFLNSTAHIAGERNWELNKRPYYDVYPSVVEALSKVDLSKVMCEHIILPIPELLIRFQEGGELGKVRNILVVKTVAYQNRSLSGMVVCIDTGEYLDPIKKEVNHSTTAIVLEPGTTIQSRLDLAKRPERTSAEFEIDDESMDAAFRLVCTICLLRGNPELITPEPMAADRARYDQTHDIKLIEKAVRRGVKRWSVGKHVEVAPGFRRPHFAVRWMGRGTEKKEPVVRPIRGCLVHRKKIEEVPTGYLDEVEYANVPN
jgi:hypothetical protein